MSVDLKKICTNKKTTQYAVQNDCTLPILLKEELVL